MFGFSSSNESAVNNFGSIIVASVLYYGLEYGMLLNNIFLFCFGIIILVCLVIHPKVQMMKVKGIRVAEMQGMKRCMNIKKLQSSNQPKQ